MKKGKITLLLLSILLIILLTGCADAHMVDFSGEPSGFWSGLWHGLISFFTFIGSLFNENVAMYDINNTGGWYDFGFLIGVGGISFSYKKT